MILFLLVLTNCITFLPSKKKACILWQASLTALSYESSKPIITVETKNENYNISFFRPTTELALLNRNLAIKLLIVWVVAIFGFHILLRILEKPTPEPAYTAFENVWEKVNAGDASLQEKQVFVKSALSVLGKLSIQAEDRLILDQAISTLSYELLSDIQRPVLIAQLGEFEVVKEDISSLSDANYMELKAAISQVAAEMLGVDAFSLEAQLMPFEIKAKEIVPYSPGSLEAVPGVMAMYLIHNQSILTDTIFLGFPFHYFYTAVFLLILFVGLCWYYCYRTDRVYRRLGIEEAI